MGAPEQVLCTDHPCVLERSGRSPGRGSVDSGGGVSRRVMKHVRKAASRPRGVAGGSWRCHRDCAGTAEHASLCGGTRSVWSTAGESGSEGTGSGPLRHAALEIAAKV